MSITTDLADIAIHALHHLPTWIHFAVVLFSPCWGMIYGQPIPVA